MKESQFIGTLMPSHPDFETIVQELREKYTPESAQESMRSNPFTIELLI